MVFQKRNSKLITSEKHWFIGTRSLFKNETIPLNLPPPKQLAHIALTCSKNKNRRHDNGIWFLILLNRPLDIFHIFHLHYLIVNYQLLDYIFVPVVTVFLLIPDAQQLFLEDDPQLIHCLISKKFWFKYFNIIICSKVQKKNH